MDANDFKTEESQSAMLGVSVRTTIDAGAEDWSKEAKVIRRWGVTGIIVEYHNSHGLIFGVSHNGFADEIGYYEPRELERRNLGLKPRIDEGNGSPPLEKVRHHVTVEFDIDAAPEVSKVVEWEIRNRLYTSMALDNTLGYTLFSFNEPVVVSDIEATVLRETTTVREGAEVREKPLPYRKTQGERLLIALAERDHLKAELEAERARGTAKDDDKDWVKVACRGCKAQPQMAWWKFCPFCGTDLPRRKAS